MDKKIQSEEELIASEKLDTPHQDGDTVSDVSTHTDVPPRKSGLRKRYVAALIAGVVALLGAAGAAWYFIAGPGSSSQQTSSSSSTAARIASSAEHVAAVFAEVDGNVAPVATTTSLGGQTRSGALVYDFAPYQVPGTSFRVLPASGKGTAVAVADAAAAANALKAAEELLTGKGEMKRTSDSTADAGGLASQSLAQIVSYAIYRSDDALCSLAHLVSSGEHTVSIGCADAQLYSTAAQAVRPFADAYAKANPAKIEGTQIFSSPQIADGKDGIKQATLYQRIPGQVGGASLYYTAKDSSTWQFIGGAYSGTVPCSTFATPEQKAAFEGGVCYDESQKKDRSI